MDHLYHTIQVDDKAVSFETESQSTIDSVYLKDESESPIDGHQDAHGELVDSRFESLERIASWIPCAG